MTSTQDDTATLTETDSITCQSTTFAAIGAEWDALLPEAATPLPFVSRAWAEAWWSVFGNDNQLLLLAARDAVSKLVAVAPLMIVRTDDLGRTVRFIGGTDVTDYLDLVAREADTHAAWGAVARWLLSHRDKWDTLDFHYLPDWSPSRAALMAVLAPALAVVEGQEEVCPVVALPGSFDAYLKAIAKKERHEIRRKAKNLLRDFPDAHLVVLHEREAALAALPDFFRLHRLSAPDKEAFLTPRVETFFATLTSAMAEAGWLALYTLEIGGVRVAAMYAFIADGRLLVYNSGYDPQHGAVSVGMVLTGMMIEHAADAGLRVCDFLRGNESYKYRFGAADTPLWRVLAGTDRATIERARDAMVAALAVPADARDVPDRMEREQGADE